jgi:hypothetical protein
VRGRSGMAPGSVGPVISVHNGTVVGIRHNDLDRLTDLPPPGAAGEKRLTGTTGCKRPMMPDAIQDDFPPCRSFAARRNDGRG